MLWGCIIIVAYFFFKRPKTINVYISPEIIKPQYYYKELTEQELQKVSDHVLETLKSYHDAYVGEQYPELVYEAIHYLRDHGKLSKEQFEAELKKLTDKIII